MSDDKKNAYDTLLYVLVSTCKLMAPVAPVMAEYVYRTLTGNESVHLADWPEICDCYRNDELLSQISLVQNVISLSHSLRNKNRIKNRQPLSTLRVALASKDAAEIVRSFTDVIAEELNVKVVEVVDDVSAIATVSYAPDFMAIRSNYGSRVPQLIKAIKSNKFRLTDDAAILDIDGTEESFDPAIILVTYQAKDGGHVMSEHGVVVSLDLTITDELKAEGIARELVRNIQDARKQSGCEISDRIILQIDGNYPKAFEEYICKETLAEIGTVTEPAATSEVETADGIMKIAIAKA